MNKGNTNMKIVRENSKVFKQKKIEIYILFTISLYSRMLF
jgi:hypothetical protein